MEAFSLLNYWKSNGSVSFLPQSSDSSCRYSAGESTGTTTIVTSVTETEDEEADDNDEGPFFDLEFALPAEEDETEEDGGRRGGGEGDSDCTEGGCEYKFTISSCSGGEDRVDPDLDFSPSDDVFFKGTIEEEEEVEPPSSSSTGTEQTCSVKAPAAQLSASILKSATKLRVFMLGMKKSKLMQAKSEANFRSADFNKPNSSPPIPPSHSPESQSQQKSTVTVNLKVEDVPIISLFTRENSSKDSSSSSSSSSASSLKKQNGNESVVSDEKRFMMMQKYLKKVKPLYIRVSRRYGEKLRDSGQLSIGSSAPTSRSTAEKTESPARKTHKPGNINIPAGLKVVRKHLGKSRSSSSTATAPSSTAATVTTTSESRRRDDSLLQQQDSIQSAILHCKRSFNSSRDKDPLVLPRSVSDPSSSNEK